MVSKMGSINLVTNFKQKGLRAKDKRLLNLKPIRHTFFGKRFIFQFGIGPSKQIGGCTSRRAKQPRLMVDCRLRGKQHWEVLMHEGIHACFDHRMSEATVTRLAKDLTGFIYKVHAAVNPDRKKK